MFSTHISILYRRSTLIFEGETWWNILKTIVAYHALVTKAAYTRLVPFNAHNDPRRGVLFSFYRQVNCSIKNCSESRCLGNVRTEMRSRLYGTSSRALPHCTQSPLLVSGTTNTANGWILWPSDSIRGSVLQRSMRTCPRRQVQERSLQIDWIQWP